MNVNKAHQNIMKVIKEINLEKQLYDFDKAHNDFPLYKWARMYMRQVMSLLNFMCSIKIQIFTYIWHLLKIYANIFLAITDLTMH